MKSSSRLVRWALRLLLAAMPVAPGCGIQLDPILLAPSAPFRLTPSSLHYPCDATMLPTNDGGAVSVWRVRAMGSPKGTVVIMPGADANKGRYSLLLPIFVDKGWNVVLYDYPGFGDSPGPASLAGLLSSTRCVLDDARAHDQVVVGYGVSLGADVLARVAAEYDLAACIFESPGNLWEIGSDLMTFNHIPPPFGNLADGVIQVNTSEDFDMKRWITKVKGPKLFLHSPDDSLTPWEKTWALFKLAPQPKHIIATRGDHAQQLFEDPNLYRSLINGWLDGVLKLDPIQNSGFQQLLDEEIRATLEEYGLAPKS